MSKAEEVKRFAEKSRDTAEEDYEIRYWAAYLDGFNAAIKAYIQDLRDEKQCVGH